MLLGSQAPDTHFLPSICEAAGCLQDAAPGNRFCWKHIRSRVIAIKTQAERQKHSVVDMVARKQRMMRSKVYAVACGDAVKFGVAVDPKSRFSGLQTGSPFRLELLGAIGCERRIEKDIHAYCADHHLRGEWYRREGRASDIVRLIVSEDVVRLYELVATRPSWILGT
jgi:hypothetical protein